MLFGKNETPIYDLPKIETDTGIMSWCYVYVDIERVRYFKFLGIVVGVKLILEQHSSHVALRYDRPTGNLPYACHFCHFIRNRPNINMSSQYFKEIMI